MKKRQATVSQAMRFLTSEFQNPICRLFFPVALLILMSGFSACSKDKEECPEGFEGESCDLEKTPTRLEITSIDVIDFSDIRSNGTHWDDSESGIDKYPDIKIRLYEMVNGNSTLLLGETTTKPNVQSGAVHRLNPKGVNAIIILKPGSQHRVILYDDDDGIQNDDLIYGPTFTPYTSGDKFPARIPVKGTNFHIELAVKYYWN